MSVTPITQNNIASAIVKLVAAEALPALEGVLVMGGLVNRNYEAVLANAGDQVSVPVFPTLEANNIAETGTVTTQVASLGSVQVTLNCHAETSFVITDIAKAMTHLDLAQGLIRAAMYALAKKIETDILSCYTLSTFNSAVGGAASISEAVIDSAETSLWKSKVPVDVQKYLVITGGTYSDLRLIPRFSENDKLGPAGAAAITGASLGKIKDFNVIRSHFVAVTGTAPSQVAHNIAFAPDFLTLATRRLPLPLPGTGAVGEYAEKANFGMRVIMSYNPSSLAQQFTVDCLYGVNVLRQEFGLEMQTNTP